MPRVEDRNLFPAGFKTKRIVARDLLASYGWRKFSVGIAPWLLRKRYLFFVHNLLDPGPIPSSSFPIRLERVEEENLADYLAVRPGYVSRAVLERRLAAGHPGFLVRAGSEPIHTRWAFLGSVYLPYLGRTLVLPDLSALTDEAYTTPSYRNRGISTLAGYMIRLALRDMGFRRSYNAVASWNMPALKIAAKAGARLVGEGSRWCLPGFRKHSWKGGIRDDGRGSISFT